MLPFGDELAVLVQDLHAVVVAIADEEPAARVHRERVRLIELAGTGAELPEALDQLAGFVELQDARVRARRRGVPFGDEDVAVRRDEHVVWLIEIIGRAGAAGFAQR